MVQLQAQKRLDSEASSELERWISFLMTLVHWCICCLLFWVVFAFFSLPDLMFKKEVVFSCLNNGFLQSVGFELHL